ncbi:MAG TPA: DUF1344 domain-containing protein [Rhizobiales bacterium]|nr:DUF1344 domain-containing protein [Hyphomicrobiales bacterium]
MRAILIPAALAAVLSTTALTFAATQHTAGTVKVYDSKAMTLTLADGSTFMLPKNFKDPGLKAGEKVSIDWEQKDGQKQADTVTISN